MTQSNVWKSPGDPVALLRDKFLTELTETEKNPY